MVLTTPETLSPAQQDQAEARDRYRESCDEHKPLTGKELGALFGRGPKWGEIRIQEVNGKANTETEDDPEPVNDPKRKWLRIHLPKRPKQPKGPVPRPRRERPEPVQRPQRRGASFAAWLAFGIGIIISVSANVGHIWFVTQPSDEALVSAMVFAAFWPVALAVAVEVLSRVTWPAGFRWPGLIGTILVGGVALVVSYRHMNGLLLYFGESDLSAMLGPVGVDGLLIVGGFALLAIGETKKRVR
ncbi:DUF2637 domain-containing protein [Glycomyces sp. NPDC021274]|uniref:DUF2637 domain-containing protein n=1 Tax=Glycomyces sp. NPDC021274 TaxID=3155120 RepID=UPI0033F7B7A3